MRSLRGWVFPERGRRELEAEPLEPLVVVRFTRGRFVALDRRIDRMKTRLDGRIDGHQSRIDGLQSSMDAMRSDLTQVAVAVGVRPRAQHD